MDPFRLEQEGMLLSNMTKFLHKRGWQDPYIPQPSTPLKFHIAPEKWWLEDCFPIGKVTFQGLCWTSGGYTVHFGHGRTFSRIVRQSWRSVDENTDGKHGIATIYYCMNRWAGFLSINNQFQQVAYHITFQTMIAYPTKREKEHHRLKSAGL